MMYVKLYHRLLREAPLGTGRLPITYYPIMDRHPETRTLLV